VDNQYDFQNEPNEYSLNDLAVFELNKIGFTALKSNNIQPVDKNVGTCNSLSMSIEVKGSLDRRITLFFEDCDGNVVYTSKQGVGSAKTNQKAYYQAMREAVSSLSELNYKYIPASSESLVSQSKSKPLTSLAVDKAKNEVPTESLKTTMIYEYSAPNTSYNLQSQGDDFMIWNEDKIIGNLKRSGGGCYLAITTDFIGIGYFKEGVMMIEANQKGEEVQLSFIKN
jgi:hypothetical protein